MLIRVILKTFYLPLLVSVFSCTENVELNFRNENPTVVLNCILNTEQDTITAWLTKSNPVSTDNEFESIEDAEVTLFEEGEAVGVFSWSDSSAYILPIKPKPGKKYKIEAQVEGKTIWAETKIPNSANAIFERVYPVEYGSHYKVSFNDDQNADNFYWISATGNEKYAGEVTKTNIAHTIYSNFLYADDFNQFIFQNGIYKFEYAYYIRFEDKEFQGNDVEIVFQPMGISSPEVFLLSVDYHLDKYMKSSLMLEEMNLYVEESPVIYSPFPVYSNIHGGTGIFGAVNSCSKVFLKKVRNG